MMRNGRRFLRGRKDRLAVSEPAATNLSATRFSAPRDFYILREFCPIAPEIIPRSPRRTRPSIH